MFRVLENRYGNKTTIALQIVEELEKIPAVRGNQPRKVMDLIQAVEKALGDLTILGESRAINHPLMIRSIESKLPVLVKRDWLTFQTDPQNGVKPDNHFDILLTFLKKQEVILERLEQLRVSGAPEMSEKPQRDQKKENEKSGKGSGKGGELTEEQKLVLSKTSPELAEKIKRAFTNKTAVTSSASKKEGGLLKRSGLREHPVIMMLLEVTANDGQKIGALIDLASDTNYITHRAADRLRLKSEEITLVVNGVGGMTVTVDTKRYLLKVKVTTPGGTKRAHELVCYGLEEIARVHQVVKPEELKRFFPEVEMEELVRPQRIELLISHREGRLAPQRVKIIGDLVLWESPLGKTVGGAHPSLLEEVEVAVHKSKTHFARSMRTAAVKFKEIPKSPESLRRTQVSSLRQEEGTEIRSTTATSREVLEWWKWDSIGAACEPRCGGCRYGTCQPEGKEMTLPEERELEVIKKGLSYITKDEHCLSPHGDASYPI
ncbi:hypothetical protein SKAU_G00285730 [Synaphobranchus kaupii]|uniref:Uncharacterized protein n=1 Tax=Synaphobranchus kaupii TaxID=118154 RepID=A0A9Q1EY19_SYNKA|nr:hypothetical protein SKAU_G00285730 [Synaphobranchus kaupii]